MNVESIKSQKLVLMLLSLPNKSLERLTKISKLYRQENPKTIRSSKLKSKKTEKDEIAEGGKMDLYSVTLDSGRIIYLEKLYQSYTYSGLLEGTPTLDMNLNIIKAKLNSAKEKPWTNNDALLIPPKNTFKEVLDLHIGFNPQLYDNDRYAEFERMPEIVIISSWKSYEPARDENMMMSELKIVWFQNRWAFPIDNMMLEEIKNINWEKYASDYDL